MCRHGPAWELTSCRRIRSRRAAKYSFLHPCGPETSFEAFLANRDPDRPFSFWLGTLDPHRPYVEGSGAESGIDTEKVHVPGFLPDVAEVRSDIADYYFEVQRWDGDVGKAIELLEAAGELENTIVVMTGDHGMPFPRCKGNLYDWGARVPLAIRWGKCARPGRVVSEFTSFTDLAPTFLEAAGLQVPEKMTGRSLLPVLVREAYGQAAGARETTATELPHEDRRSQVYRTASIVRQLSLQALGTGG